MARRGIEQARDDLRDAVVSCGFPVEFALALEAGLRTENAMGRMARYLRGARPRSMEEAADEMVAICSMRDSWVEHKISEHAQAKMTAFYNRPRDEE